LSVATGAAEMELHPFDDLVLVRLNERERSGKNEAGMVADWG
jgi:hypothetical protein